MITPFIQFVLDWCVTTDAEVVTRNTNEEFVFCLLHMIPDLWAQHCAAAMLFSG